MGILVRVDEEPKANGYLKGQIWNRETATSLVIPEPEEPEESYLQLILKSVTDMSAPSPARFEPVLAYGRKIPSESWNKADGFSPVDGDAVFTNLFGFDSNTIGSNSVRVYGYDIFQLRQSHRYFVVHCRADVTERILPEPNPVPEYIADYGSLSFATGNKPIAPGQPMLTSYIADTNLYPTSSKKNIARLNAGNNKHFAQIDLSANDDVFVGKTFLWFAVEFDMQNLDPTVRVIPTVLPVGLPLPATVPPQTILGMNPWSEYLGLGGNINTGYGNPYTVTIDDNPTLSPAP